jgi:Kef-type K+ transport system membrane component KefB
VRWILVLIFALVLIAYHLGLDLLLGGFAAGLITRHRLGSRDAHVFESKLTAVAFGAFVPFFFVVSGMNLDLPALFGSVGSVAKMGLYSCCSWSSAVCPRCCSTAVCSVAPIGSRWRS